MRSPCEDICHRSTGAVIWHPELSQPFVQLGDATIEGTEIVGGLEPPNGLEFGQALGMRLGRENSSTSSGTATGASSNASTNRENSSGVSVMVWYSAITDSARATALSSTNAVIDCPANVAASRTSASLRGLTRNAHLRSRCWVRFLMLLWRSTTWTLPRSTRCVSSITQCSACAHRAVTMRFGSIARVTVCLPKIRSELVYLASLAEGSEVVVPFPIATRSGEFVALVDGADGVRHASLVTWLGGEVRRPGRSASAATLFRIGKALGRTHQFSESFDPPDGFDLPIWDVAAMFDSERLRLVESVSHRRLIERAAQWVEEHFDELTLGGVGKVTEWS